MQAFYLKRLQGIPLGNNSGFGAKSSTRSAGFQAERRNRKRYPRNIPYIPAVATTIKSSIRWEVPIIGELLAPLWLCT